MVMFSSCILIKIDVKRGYRCYIVTDLQKVSSAVLAFFPGSPEPSTDTVPLIQIQFCYNTEPRFIIQRIDLLCSRPRHLQHMIYKFLIALKIC